MAPWNIKPNHKIRMDGETLTVSQVTKKKAYFNPGHYYRIEFCHRDGFEAYSPLPLILWPNDRIEVMK